MLVTVLVRRLRERRTRLRASHDDLIGKTRETPGQQSTNRDTLSIVPRLNPCPVKRCPTSWMGPVNGRRPLKATLSGGRLSHSVRVTLPPWRGTSSAQPSQGGEGGRKLISRLGGLSGSSSGDSSECCQNLSQDGQTSSPVAILPVLTWK